MCVRQTNRQTEGQPSHSIVPAADMQHVAKRHKYYWTTASLWAYSS